LHTESRCASEKRRENASGRCALHRDVALTDRNAQKGVLTATDRASSGDVAYCGCGVTLSLLPPKDRGSMNRILCSLLVATLPFGSVLAQAQKSKNAR
jgi:hypothetical protein